MTLPRKHFSIRHQLLLLGALAVGSIWLGALLQYLHLRAQSARLDGVSADLDASVRLADVARLLARERGLSHGWTASGAAPDREALLQARAAVDLSVAAVAPFGIAEGPGASVLAQRRAAVDARTLAAAESFRQYSALVARVQAAAAARMRRSMIEVGVPYEHIGHLARANEQLAQLRGLMQGALRQGPLDAATAGWLREPLALHHEALRQYEETAPAAALQARAAAVHSVARERMLAHVERVLAAAPGTPPAALAGLAADGWWPLASAAVDASSAAAMQDLQALTAEARAKVRAHEWQLWLTMAALLVLGIVTLALVLATVGRIVRSLGRLLAGLDGVASGRNFDVRIDDSRADEFGAISSEINRLIGIASSVLGEQSALARVDPLTGVMNRRGFDQQLAARLRPDRANRGPLCVLMVDADHFKRINDTLGHGVGDQVLRALAGVLRERLRADDVLARFGGEEFVALLPACRMAEAVQVAQAVCEAVAAHDFGIGAGVTVSIGVAQSGEAIDAGEAAGDAVTGLGLIQRADAALYAAKASGRNRVVRDAAAEAAPTAAPAARTSAAGAGERESLAA